jgi:hypothetical protein
MDRMTENQAGASSMICRDERRERPGRPYSPPRLRVFGDVRAITLSGQTTNKNDPGNGAQLRT